jgi:hypothetical protein
MNFPIKKTLYYAILLIIPGGSLALAGVELFKYVNRKRKESKNVIRVQDKGIGD